MIFNWNDFKNKKVVVHCNNKNKLNNFFQKCEENGIHILRDRNFCNDLYYEVSENILLGGTFNYYKGENYKIIEWELENHEGNNYNKEYNIQEVMRFPVDTEFIVKAHKVVIKENEWGEKCLFCKNAKKALICNESIITAKFALVKTDKKVSFEKAIQSYGKKIYCIWKDCKGIERRNYYIINNEYSQIEGDLIYSLCPEQILNGQWYIKESEDNKLPNLK